MTEEEVLKERLALFHKWKQDPITVAVFSKIRNEVEEMMEGLVWDTFDNPEQVKGRIQAAQKFLTISIEDVYG